MYTLECAYTDVCGENFIAMPHDRNPRKGGLGLGILQSDRISGWWNIATYRGRNVFIMIPDFFFCFTHPKLMFFFSGWKRRIQPVYASVRYSTPLKQKRPDGGDLDTCSWFHLYDWYFYKGLLGISIEVGNFNKVINWNLSPTTWTTNMAPTFANLFGRCPC